MILRTHSKKNLRKLSDKDFDKYCSEIIKKIVNSYKEVGEFEVY